MHARWRVLLIAGFLPFGAAYGAPGAVDGNPSSTAKGFKPHELPFVLAQDGVARDEFRSAHFYAVILETLAPCSITEAHRLEIQSLFPERKVFATRFQCDDDVEEGITYTNVNAAVGFVAVFAGGSLSDAKKVLAAVQKLNRFPGANLRRMQVVRVGS